MESMTRNVRDLDTEKRRSLETVLGHELQDNQQVMIQVIALNAESNRAQAQPSEAKDHGHGAPQLPQWCNVYDGLSEDEIVELEKAILRRADLTRSFD